MINLRDLLHEMIEKKASDLHITAGLSPQLRIDGQVTPTPHEKMTPEDTLHITYSVLNEEQQKRFEAEKELDFSFGVKGLSRFRANVFLQRGVVSLAIRQIPYEILDMRTLGLPQRHRETCGKTTGHDPRYRVQQDVANRQHLPASLTR